MTPEEAIEELKDASDSEVRYGDTERHYNEVMKRVEAFDMAIKALEQQPCEDCISREATIDAIYKKYIGGKDAIKKAPINDLYAEGLAEAVDAVWELPSVTPTRPTGKWIEKEDYNLDTYYECSECGADYCIEGDILIHKYCPNCGAKMDEVETEEEDER